MIDDSTSTDTGKRINAASHVIAEEENRVSCENAARLQLLKSLPLFLE